MEKVLVIVTVISVLMLVWNIVERNRPDFDTLRLGNLAADFLMQKTCGMREKISSNCCFW